MSDTHLSYMGGIGLVRARGPNRRSQVRDLRREVDRFPEARSDDSTRRVVQVGRRSLRPVLLLQRVVNHLLRYPDYPFALRVSFPWPNGAFHGLPKRSASKAFGNKRVCPSA